MRYWLDGNTLKLKTSLHNKEYTHVVSSPREFWWEWRLWLTCKLPEGFSVSVDCNRRSSTKEFWYNSKLLNDLPESVEWFSTIWVPIQNMSFSHVMLVGSLLLVSRFRSFQRSYLKDQQKSHLNTPIVNNQSRYYTLLCIFPNCWSLWVGKEPQPSKQPRVGTLNRLEGPPTEIRSRGGFQFDCDVPDFEGVVFSVKIVSETVPGSGCPFVCVRILRPVRFHNLQWRILGLDRNTFYLGNDVSLKYGGQLLQTKRSTK